MSQLAAEARAGGAALAVFVFLLLAQEAQGQCLIEHKVTASDGSAFARLGCFGAHLDTLVVGAPLDDERGVDSSAVYLFDRNRGGIGSWGESRSWSHSTEIPWTSSAGRRGCSGTPSPSALVAVTVMHKHHVKMSFSGFVVRALPYALVHLVRAVLYVLFVVPLLV